MVLSYAANAVLSKARTLYGRCMKPKNYKELLNCRNISDIASYLKRRTDYSDVLFKINENNVHRTDLENSLNSKLFVDFESLGRYDLWVGEHFFDYMIVRAEIEQIMRSLMLISAGEMGEYICSVPEFFHKHTKIDLKSLANIRNYDEFLSKIKKSPYYKILLPYIPKSGENINLIVVETVLHNYLYEVLFGIINKYVKGKAKRQLVDFFKTYIDLTNLIRIVRMKKFYKLSFDYMSKGLISYGRMSRSELEKFIECESNEKMMADMKETSVGRKWFSKGLDIVDKVPTNMKYNWCRHNIRFSISPPIVLMSYIFLKEVEILNLTNIIEGVKYGSSPDEIKKMLIGAE